MAERRMFSKTIADSDQFLEMPLSAQALYFHLCLRADDDGFINNARGIQHSIGATPADMDVLLENQYVLPFQSSVVVIRHWKIHNSIQKDRYHPAIYTNERSQLEVDHNKAYYFKTESDTECIHGVSIMESEVSLQKRHESDSTAQDRSSVCAR